MFPECRLMCTELNALNRIAVDEQCVIIIVRGVLIGLIITTDCVQFPMVDGIALDSFCHGLNDVLDSVMLLMIPIKGFLKSLLIAPLRRMDVIRQCIIQISNWYKNHYTRCISTSNISKFPPLNDFIGRL